MNRTALVILGIILGPIVAIALVAFYIDWTYPNYTRDSSVPPVFPAIIFGGPVGLAAGALFGALFPLKSDRS